MRFSYITTNMATAHSQSANRPTMPLAAIPPICCQEPMPQHCTCGHLSFTKPGRPPPCSVGKLSLGILCKCWRGCHQHQQLLNHPAKWFSDTCRSPRPLQIGIAGFWVISLKTNAVTCIMKMPGTLFNPYSLNYLYYYLTFELVKNKTNISTLKK